MNDHSISIERLGAPHALLKRIRLKNIIFIVLTTIFSFVHTYSAEAQIIEIGNRRQLFIDNKFVLNKNNTELRVHKPQKTGDIIITSDSVWILGGYGCVFEKDGIYHMWYPVSRSLGYACSTDGIHWRRPSFNFTTSDAVPKPNNIVLGHGAVGTEENGGMVFLDPMALEEQQFRLVTNSKERFIQIFSSADGVHWCHSHKDLVTFDKSSGKFHHLDSQNVIFWDTRLKKYVTYIRNNTLSNEPGNKQVRNVARGESFRLEYFGNAAEMPIVMHGSPREDIYTSGVMQYPWADEVYLAFPTLYYHYGEWHKEFSKEAPFNAGVIDTRIAVSRDGVNWNNFNWDTFIPIGMDGEFDSKIVYTFYGIVPSLNGRELYMYYTGYNWPHGWDDGDRNPVLLTKAGMASKLHEQGAISRVVLRRDGFVSIHAPFEGGEFTTPPLRFKGNQLVLNIENASTGETRVEIRDEFGKPIPGFTLTDCDLIHSANEINRPVKWNGKSDVKILEGKVIQLHFPMRDTDLYAFQFRDRLAF